MSDLKQMKLELLQQAIDELVELRACCAKQSAVFQKTAKALSVLLVFKTQIQEGRI